MMSAREERHRYVFIEKYIDEKQRGLDARREDALPCVEGAVCIVEVLGVLAGKCVQV